MSLIACSEPITVICSKRCSLSLVSFAIAVALKDKATAVAKVDTKNLGFIVFLIMSIILIGVI